MVVHAREWTNANGTKIDAEFLRQEADQVVLKMKGREYKVALKSLSKEDQTHVAELKKAAVAAKEAEANRKFPLSLENWVHGEKLVEADSIGRPVVFHQWQAHCAACPPKLEEFEKMARRKKRTGAVFMVWHSADKTELAEKVSDQLRLT